MTKLMLIVAFLAIVFITMFTTTAYAATRVQNFYIPDETTVRRNHRTHLFRSQTWYILRRASDVNFQVQLDAELKEGQSMSFQIAPYSIIDNSSIKLNHVSGGTYTIQASLSPDAPVGIFSIGLRLSDSNVVRQLPKQVAVLFNAWSPYTDEYFPRPDELSEYIEQEHGITYRGSTSQVQDVRWYLGQFTQEALTVTLYFVNRLNETERRDPALVSRHLTRVFAQQDTVPDGLMMGKWEGGFGGGTNPSTWASSDQIFRAYINQGFNTVKFAQCWVFGAVLLSSLRTMGLASNQVSVMDSTHEYAAERTGIYMARIGKYYEQNYRYMVAESGKIWNFHSFNLVYLMNRHADWPYNLPDWQVVDSTPQEFSFTGDYRLGPAPLKAIRENQKSSNFDTPFVIGEVSARHHSFLVSCQYGAFGGGQRLPPGCKVTKDLGAAAHVASGTYIVAKAVTGFTQQPWTHMFHTRARSPAEDPSVLTRFPAVRAFDILRNDDPTGFSSLIMDTPRATTSANGASELRSTPRTASSLAFGNNANRNNFSTFANNNNIPTTLINDSFDDYNVLISDKHDYEEDSSNYLLAMHSEDEVDVEKVFKKKVKLNEKGELITTNAENDEEDSEVALYQYKNTGVAMSIVIPPVELGKPLELYLNFACESQTPSFKNQLTRKDLTTKVVTLSVNADDNNDKIITDDDHHDDDNNNMTLIDDVTVCPSVAAISFHLDLQLTDYTTREIGKIAEIDGQIVLRQNNGYFESYRIVVNNYVNKALASSKEHHETIPEYVRAIVMATDHSTDPKTDIIMFAERTSMINMPKLSIKPSQTRFIIPRTTPNIALDNGNTLYTSSNSINNNININNINTPITTTTIPTATPTTITPTTTATPTTNPMVMMMMQPNGVMVPTTATPTAAMTPPPHQPGFNTVPTPMTTNAATALMPNTDNLKTNYPVDVVISYHNQLQFDLTNVILTISADNLGFDAHTINIGTLKSGMKLTHTHSFNIFHSTDGLHFYNVVLVSDQLTPTHAEVDFFINDTKFVSNDINNIVNQP